MSSFSTSLNPNAAEFVPSFLTNNRSPNSCKNHSRDAFVRKKRDPHAARTVSEPRLKQTESIPAVSPYLLALNSERAADGADKEKCKSVKSIPFATSKASTYEEELSKWKSRRITTVHQSVTNKFKSRWMEIARDSVKLASPASGGAGRATGSDDSPDTDVVAAGPAAAWHNILGHGPPHSQSQQHLLVSNAALHAAEASQMGTANPRGTKNTEPSEGYVKWWSAILGADLVAMTALLDAKCSWDTAFNSEHFHRVSHKRAEDFRALSGNMLSIAPTNATVDISGLSALHVCSMLQTHVLILEQLLQYDAVRVNVDLRERKHKRTAVHYAALAGNLEGLRILVSYGIDLEAKDRSGNSVLHIACKQNHAAMVAFVCDKARRLVNCGNKSSDTALLLTRSREVAQLLIAAGADVTCRNAQGLDAATLAAQAGHTSLLQVLLTSNSSHQKSVNGNTATTLAAKYKTYSTPLHAASSQGHLPCVRLLLSLCAYNKPQHVLHSCGVHCLDRPAYHTPLMCAALHGHAEVFAALVLHGADPKAETVGGVTALAMAVAAPLVSVDFITAVCRALTPVGGSERVTVEGLLQDNSAGQSLLASVLQQITRAARIDIRHRERVMEILEPFWPKIVSLLAAGAPLRSDFLVSVAHSQCTRCLAQSGLDLRRPLHEWRAVLSKPIYWDPTPDGSVQPGSAIPDHINCISPFGPCSQVVPNIATTRSRTTELLSAVAEELSPSSLYFGDGLGLPDVRIVVAGSSVQQEQELHAHSFVLQSERAGVLRSMVLSEMTCKVWVSTADGGQVCTMLNFPHVSKSVFERVLWWIYTGRDVCYRQSAQVVLELLYVANELLVQGLQQLCEAHLCLRHSELGSDALAQLAETIHCPVLNAFLARSERGERSSTAAIHSFLANHSVEFSNESLQVLFLRFVYAASRESACSHAVLSIVLLQSALGAITDCCYEHAAAVPDGIARLSAMLATECSAASTDEICNYETEALLCALLCWQQRLLLRLQLLQDVHSSDVMLRLRDASSDYPGSDGGSLPVTIAAHRCVLAQRSPKMAAMIRFTLAQAQQQRAGGDCAESDECVPALRSSAALALDVQGISEQALRALLLYIYTDCLPADAPAELLLELAAVADEHIMPHLSFKLDRQLVKVLSCDNSLQSFCAAQQFQLPLLRTISALFVIKQYGGCGLCGDSQAMVEADNCRNADASAYDLLAEALLSLVA